MECQHVCFTAKNKVFWVGIYTYIPAQTLVPTVLLKFLENSLPVVPTSDLEYNNICIINICLIYFSFLDLHFNVHL